MRFKIPQNVQIEDKILWILSIKDLVIAGVGGGIAYVAYLELDGQTWPFISIPVVVLTLAIIFVKLNNMSFGQWVYSLALYLIRPQKRVWQNMSNEPVLFDLIYNPQITSKKKNDPTEQLLSQKQKTLKEINELSSILDKGSTAETVENIPNQDSQESINEIELSRQKAEKLKNLMNHKK